MDRIAIKDLRIYAYHGVRDFEKEHGQLFILDVDIFADLSEACRTDNLEATINYSQAAQSIKRVMTENRYDLIETAAQAVADCILAEFSLAKSVRVCLKKPNAPIAADFGYVAVDITRSRESE